LKVSSAAAEVAGKNGIINLGGKWIDCQQPFASLFFSVSDTFLYFLLPPSTGDGNRPGWPLFRDVTSFRGS
jgi:hypothetical protein